jgi:DNA polymerase I-like protein with 3'-5' exonuclease and polymerase domains
MSGLAKWQRNTRQFYDTNGYVEGPTGWRRYGPIEHGEVINTPIQNGEAEIVMDAMTRLSEAAQELDAWQFQARLEVHDELGFWIPKKTIDRDLEFISQEMLMCDHLPWINVPLCLEISSGPNWFDQKEVSTIYSDDLGLLDRKKCGF